MSPGSNHLAREHSDLRTGLEIAIKNRTVARAIVSDGTKATTNMQNTSAFEQIFDAVRLVQDDLSKPTLAIFQQLHDQFLHLLRVTEIATDYHPGPKETRSSILALTELRDGMGQLLERCEAHVRSNDFDFRANLAYHVNSVLRNSLGAKRAEKVQYRQYCRQAEEKLQRLVDAINQVRRKCPCGKHTYRARLNTEPAIVSVLAADNDPPSVPDGRTYPFDDVQAFQPSSNASASSFSPAPPPPTRPKIWITDYFKHK